MDVFFDPLFYQVYTSDPAADQGRMEAVTDALDGYVRFQAPKPATREQILAAHTAEHVDWVRGQMVYDVAALAAGGAISAARLGMEEPSFALIRPPGHHASADAAWGFCYFNNMAVALMDLHAQKLIQSAFVLDFDLHFGDGNQNILGPLDWVEVFNPTSGNRVSYLEEVMDRLDQCRAEVIGVSAGFDNHQEDWGGVLSTEDYRQMGEMVRQAAQRNRGGCFGILEGGYNHQVLGQNVLAFIQGLEAV